MNVCYYSVQNILNLQHKKPQFWVLFIWVYVRVMHRVSENKILSRIFGHKGESSRNPEKITKCGDLQSVFLTKHAYY
jgi:hypothetical protein